LGKPGSEPVVFLVTMIGPAGAPGGVGADDRRVVNGLDKGGRVPVVFFAAMGGGTGAEVPTELVAFLGGGCSIVPVVVTFSGTAGGAAWTGI
jgi:hypothetical protein